MDKNKINYKLVNITLLAALIYLLYNKVIEYILPAQGVATLTWFAG